MLSNKNKTLLKKLAIERNILKFNIGKSVLTDNAIKNIENYLFKYELVKISFLKSSFSDPEGKNELMLDIVSSLKAEVVDKIGNTMLLYRPNKDAKDHIKLLKD